MPLRLYRDDSYLTRFTAKVIDAAPSGMSALALELDRTAFYPTGGGQPHDTGHLGDLRVTDVREAGDGRVLHIVDSTVAPAGDVEGTIDWPRRFDHMQQHTGQHILSRAFVDVARAQTRSFHLGESVCTIDLDLAQADEATVRQAEARANAVIFGDRPVEIDQVPADRAPQLAADMNLLRDLALKPGDPIRIIKVEGFDETPCGGTHVRRAGEVGCVAVRSWERFKGGTRVTFLCGGRAVTAIAQMGAILDSCVAKLSTQPAELPAAIGRLQEQVAEARRTTKALSETVAEAEALSLEATARTVGRYRAFVEVLPQRSLDDVQLLARKLTAAGGRLAFLATNDPATGKASLVFARSDEPALASIMMGEILKSVCASRGGKGGGGPALARGGGIPAEAASQAVEEAFTIVAARLTA